MLPILYLGYFIFCITGSFSGQKYARSSKGSIDTMIYSVVTGIIAMLMFCILSGFNLNFNIRTVIYSVAFAILIYINYFFTLSVYKYMGIAETTFIKSGFTLILSVVVGKFFYNETFKTVFLIQIVLVLLTFLSVFYQNKKISTENYVSFKGFLLCLIGAVMTTFTNAVSNSFAKDTLVTDENSFCFLTNVFIVILALISVAIMKKCALKNLFKSFKSVSKIGYFMILINVISSNIETLLRFLILKRGSLILYAPLSAALGVLAGEAVAVFIAKEKPKIIATVLAICSVLVVLLF